MKRIIAFILTIVTIMSSSILTLAKEQQTTTLTATVPEATYTLQIPASQEIPLDEIMINFDGELKVSESKGFFLGKALKLTVSKSDLKLVDGTEVIEDYGIFFTDDERTAQELFMNGDNMSSAEYIFRPSSEGVLNEYVLAGDGITEVPYLAMDIASDAWRNAKPGIYEMTLTFETEVIYE